MLKRLRRRLTLICAASTAAILCAVTLLLLAASERRLMANVSAAFDGNIAAVAYRLQTEQTVSWDWLAQMETDEKLLLAVSDGGVPLKFPGVWKTPTDRDALLGALRESAPAESLPVSGVGYSARRFRLEGAGGEPYLAAAVTVPSRPAARVFYIVKDLRDVRLTGMRALCAGLVAVSAAGLAAFSWWFAGRAIAPVEESVRRQNEFIAAASHELRSPLGVMKANAAAVLHKVDASGREYAAAIDAACGRLGRLVDDLLTLASADAGRLSMRVGPVEAEELIERAAADYGPLAAARGVRLEARPPAEMLPVLAGDGQRLGQLLGILLDNALTYVPERGGKITLSACREGRQVALRVADNGPGVPDEEKEKVFRRFYRSDPARAGREHYGLGLAVARDIARLHGGTLTLLDTPGGGLTAEYRQSAAPGAGGKKRDG